MFFIIGEYTFSNNWSALLINTASILDAANKEHPNKNIEVETFFVSTTEPSNYTTQASVEDATIKFPVTVTEVNTNDVTTNDVTSNDVTINEVTTNEVITIDTMKTTDFDLRISPPSDNATKYSTFGITTKQMTGFDVTTKVPFIDTIGSSAVGVITNKSSAQTMKMTVFDATTRKPSIYTSRITDSVVTTKTKPVETEKKTASNITTKKRPFIQQELWNLVLKLKTNQ